MEPLLGPCAASSRLSAFALLAGCGLLCLCLSLVRLARSSLAKPAPEWFGTKEDDLEAEQEEEEGSEENPRPSLWCSGKCSADLPRRPVAAVRAACCLLSVYCRAEPSPENLPWDFADTNYALFVALAWVDFVVLHASVLHACWAPVSRPRGLHRALWALSGATTIQLLRLWRTVLASGPGRLAPGSPAGRKVISLGCGPLLSVARLFLGLCGLVVLRIRLLQLAYALGATHLEWQLMYALGLLSEVEAALRPGRGHGHRLVRGARCSHLRAAE